MNIRELLTTFKFAVDMSGLNTFNKSIAGTKSSLLLIGGAITAAATSIFALVKNVSNVGDEINKSSQELGLSTDALQEWRFAADQAGISNEDLATGLRLFSRNVGNAATSGTGPFVERMQALGVSLTDVNGQLKSNDDLLMETADALSQVKNQSVKGAIANEFFGRSGLRLATFLSSGSEEVFRLRKEAHELNLVLDQESTDAAEQFNDQLSKAMGVVGAIKNRIGLGLMPTMLKLVNQFLEWVKVNREVINQKLTHFFAVLAKILSAVWSAMGKVADGFEWLSKVMGSTENAVYLLIAAFALMKFAPIIMGVLGLARSMWNLAAAIVTAQGGLFFIPIAAVLILTAFGMLIKEALRFFGIIDDETADAISTFDILKTAIGAVLAAFALEQGLAFVAWLWKLVTAAGSAAVAVFGLQASFLLIPLAIAALIAALYIAYQYLQDVTGGKFAEKIKEAWASLPDWFKNLFSSIGDWIGEVFDDAVDGIKKKLTSLKEAFKDGLFGYTDEQASDKLSKITDGKVKTTIDDTSALAYDPKPSMSDRLTAITENKAPREALTNIATQYQRMEAAPSVVPAQVVGGASTTSTVTNNRPVNVNSNINITMPAGTPGSDEQSISDAVRLAFRDELDRVLETSLHNNTELE